MMVYCKKYRIISNREILAGHRLMCLEAPELAGQARPGQFLHIRCGQTSDPLLRRPISIHRVDRERGLLYMLYRLAGRGTELLAAREEGGWLDVMGPLGNGFAMPGPPGRIGLLGGGVGAAPLYFLLQELLAGGHGNSIDFYIGAASRHVLLTGPEGEGFNILAATDDGSAGFKGTVTALLEKQMETSGAYQYIYACGPTPMLRSLSTGLLSGTIVQVSLEERMGCGVGACLSCACKIKRGGGAGFEYRHACTDGPVFNLEEVVFNA